MADKSGEAENHWPGYVDALTTMTMMLIFVMMILTVAMFSMSEDVSRQQVERIAAAAGIPAVTDDMSTEDFAELVAVRLETQAGRTMMAAGSSSPVMASTEVTSPVPIVGPRPDVAPGAQAGPHPDGAPGAGSMQPLAEKRIESGAAAEAAQEVQPVRTERAPAVLTVAFKPRATALDPSSRAEMQTFVTESLGGRDLRLEMRAYASADTGSLTDSRRIAYFRAMAMRSQLIASGIPIRSIAVKIEDVPPKQESDLVQLFVRG